MDDDVADALRGVVSQLSRRLNATATHEDLSPSQASVLSVVAELRSIGIADLTRAEGLNPTMTSRIVAALEERGLVRRVSNPDDLRSITVEVTDAGTATKKRIRAQRDGVVAGALATLDSERVRAIADALPAMRELVRALDAGR
jgi:DNA-binding MarR family transcriptional regulator